METYNCLVFILGLLVITNALDAGVSLDYPVQSLRQRIFPERNGSCRYEDFRCLNGKCISRNWFCDGAKDCADNSDEYYCKIHSCSSARMFDCNKDYYHKCIPLLWKCNGYKDCPNGEDEQNCGEEMSLGPNSMVRMKYFALNWTHQLRKKEEPLRKWGYDVARIAVALHLANDIGFYKDSAIRNEITYELSLSLLSKLAMRNMQDVSTTELASYVNAFLVTCINPRKFYGLDLVSELRKRVDARNYTNPSVILALCNAGERITERDIRSFMETFTLTYKEIWTDTKALAVMALACVAKQPYEQLDPTAITRLTNELKNRQYRNGTVENLKTTALVLQALFASESEADEDNFDEEKALKQILLAQKEDGSFGNLINTYYVLPLLAYKSLVNISSSHCNATVIDEQEALLDLMNQRGAKHNVQYSLWIGNNKTIERTITLNVPVNSTFYRVMEFAANIDNKFRFEYNMKNGKPYIYSISEVQDDPEQGMFWFLFELDSEGSLKSVMKSPADVKPMDKQHFVFWYKCGAWTQ